MFLKIVCIKNGRSRKVLGPRSGNWAEGPMNDYRPSDQIERPKVFWGLEHGGPFDFHRMAQSFLGESSSIDSFQWDYILFCVPRLSTARVAVIA